MDRNYETPRQLELRTRSATAAVVGLHVRLRDPQPRAVASIKKVKPAWRPAEVGPVEANEPKHIAPQILKWAAMAAAAAAPWVLLLSGSL